MKKDSRKKKIKWRTILGLLFMYLAMWYNWQWAWGVLFLIWVIPDIISGVTYFIEPVERSSEPILYWVIIISWVLMSLLSLSVLLFPEWQYY